MKAARFRLLVATWALITAACDLNPQPLPPGSQASPTTGGSGYSTGPSTGAASGSNGGGSTSGGSSGSNLGASAGSSFAGGAGTTATAGVPPIETDAASDAGARANQPDGLPADLFAEGGEDVAYGFSDGAADAGADATQEAKDSQTSDVVQDAADSGVADGCDDRGQRSVDASPE